VTDTPEPARTSGHSSATLVRSSALMASGTLVSRILGLVRVILLAGVLGLLDSPAGNAWQTANTLPNTIYILLAGGILNVILVPALTRAMEHEDRGRDFTDRLLTLAVLGLIAITVVFTAGAALLTQFFALTWSGEQLALAVAFAYLCLPQIFFYGAYTLLGQILNAQERFGWYMWAPVANNVVAIAGIVVFGAMYPEAKQLGPGDWTAPMIWLLGGTATLGVLVQAAVLLPPVLRSGFRWRPRWGFRGVGLGAASRMALWMLAVIGVSQAGMWLSTNVLNRASDLDRSAAGKIVYENAFLFFILPHSLITASLITAMFTQMSRSAHAEDLPSLRAQFDHGLRLLLVAIVPISLALFLLAPSVTAVLLFNNTLEETQATAHVTMALLVGLAPYAAYILSARIFHAFQDGRTPFRLQLVITGVSVVGILVAAALPPTVTAIGVGLSQALGQSVAAVLGVLWVRRRLRGMSLGAVRRTFTRVGLAAVVAALPTLFVVVLAQRVLDGRPAAVVILLLGVPTYFGLYAVTAHRLGVHELAEAAEPVLRRLRRRGARSAAAQPDTPTQVALAAQPSPSGTRPPDGVLVGDGGMDGRREYGVRGIVPGTALGGRYVLEELLARRGEDLDYWSAQDSTLDRLVAVTVLPATGEYEQMAHTVLDGARRTAGVDDPRLVRVLDVGLEEGRCWIVEEGLAEAESLAGLVAQRPLPAEEVRRIIGEAAQGLEAARRRGLHHLFLSPHAVLRTGEGTVKVSGVAVAAAIEQIEDIGSFEASIIDTNDLVSLLYTGLTGRWPGEEMEGLRPARRLADGSLPAPSEVVAGVPGDLDALCRLVLAQDYDPREGPQNPGELAKQLAPWSPEMVADHGQHGPDVPVSASGAPAALTGAAGAGAAVPAARPPADDGDDATPTGTPSAADHSYYRTAPAALAGDEDLDEDQDEDLVQERPEAALAAGAPPDRTLPPGTRDTGPPRSQTGIVLFLVLAVIAAGIFVAFLAFQGLGGDEDEPTPQAPTDAATQSESPTDAQETTDSPGGEGGSGEVRLGDPVNLAGITSYDPQGDDDERNDIVGQAIDGNPDTAWNSHTYLTPGWGSLKDGVGLVVDLGESVEVGEVEIQFPQGDYGAEVLVGEEPTPEGATAIGQDDQASGTWTVTAEEPVTGRYVIVWFDRAWAGPGGEIVYVSEISVRPVAAE
jgi:putative peptidoglycan lipid II flippase